MLLLFGQEARLLSFLPVLPFTNICINYSAARFRNGIPAVSKRSPNGRDARPYWYSPGEKPGLCDMGIGEGNAIQQDVVVNFLADEGGLLAGPGPGTEGIDWYLCTPKPVQGNRSTW